ncbi:septal ring lytic transglycosylase RlpA family protein [Oceanospirillum sanctuarii]|uniref:septal ring lytic transglycosylase RlpA family protein n=1 Tax=Oceanospirillum sanctuarii TaxID=1434821 RepID=UPI001FE38217|nr:septal ring lytic transglycosylase RlpA family protein [Oceanospirillum sanctuarii]
MPATFSGAAMLTSTNGVFSQNWLGRFSCYGVLLAFFALLSGCSSAPSDSRYEMQHDAAPDEVFDMSKIKELNPVYEPPSRAGNKSPYTVWGKSYSVMPSSKGYKAEGVASWYGKKFHGYHTSNGEIYDMYQLSAAHKSLPLPSYVLVTHLGNGKQVLVRVNDRGPFHDGRVIDLSYAAAARLDMLGTGTAPVRIEAIDPVTWKGGMDLAVNQLQPPVLVQVAAMSQEASARQLGSRLEKNTGQKMTVVPATVNSRLLHKVQLGPVESRSDLQRLIDQLANDGFVRPIIIPLAH